METTNFEIKKIDVTPEDVTILGAFKSLFKKDDGIDHNIGYIRLFLLMPAISCLTFNIFFIFIYTLAFFFGESDSNFKWTKLIMLDDCHFIYFISCLCILYLLVTNVPKDIFSKISITITVTTIFVSSSIMVYVSCGSVCEGDFVSLPWWFEGAGISLVSLFWFYVVGIILFLLYKFVLSKINKLVIKLFIQMTLFIALFSFLWIDWVNSLVPNF